MSRRSLQFALVAAGLGIASASMVAQEAADASPSPRRFENPIVGDFLPAEGDGFSSVLAIGDFNGDGLDDVATGIPFDDGVLGLEVENAGAVAVRYGRLGEGLIAEVELSSFLIQTDDHDPAEKGDNFGTALAACDLNGDGFDDLAVGIPLENYRGHVDGGAIQIHYGLDAGLRSVADEFITQSTPGVPGDVEEGDRFGSALACGDFDRDGFDDLAVGSPGENLFPDVEAGLVTIFSGSPSGLLERGVRDFALEDSQDEQLFGKSLAAGDFNGDGFSDLAIGTPEVDRSGEENVGCVSYVFGSLQGLTADGSETFFEGDLPGGRSERADEFGRFFAVGDFDADGIDDLIISIPYEDLAETQFALVDTGWVVVHYGSRLGPSFGLHQFFSQSLVLGSGASGLHERFGFGMAAGDFDGDGADDLAVGSPGEFVTGVNDGQVTVWLGRPGIGLWPEPSRRFVIAAGRPGIPPFPAGAGAGLGWAIASGDFDGDGLGDLVIGAPRDDSDLPDTGSQLEIYGPPSTGDLFE